MLITIFNKTKQIVLNWISKEQKKLPDFTITHTDGTSLTLSIEDLEADELIDFVENAGFEFSIENENNIDKTPRLTSKIKDYNNFQLKMPKYKP